MVTSASLTLILASSSVYISPLHSLVYYIHEFSLWSSSFHSAWQLHLKYLCLSNLVSKLHSLSRRIRFLTLRPLAPPSLVLSSSLSLFSFWHKSPLIHWSTYSTVPAFILCIALVGCPQVSELIYCHSLDPLHL